MIKKKCHKIGGFIALHYYYYLINSQQLRLKRKKNKITQVNQCFFFSNFVMLPHW